ncbi:MAG: methylmalonyl-CoA carboxyltransferase, partial [Firmicutes bacterium]|nr:methylmalonyl-CoA carboxyltransferase [Bacillota bacterium]
DEISSPYNAAGKGYVDSLIVPSNTRKRIIVALQMLMTKRENKSARKHSSVEF